ncbi:phytoene dehydrogenase [Westerdykella ornata]|uniref:Phytoene desaturase n=1 Tax=Westerdykella ornata TaxID=318751 RepID=A0A6A6JEP9_WESOR|nr:phytoene dehydrogenase [Westerdykella ornata]KAF2274458.1 phytoene dehydrogenase [Westerdykella ornata]
MLIELEAQIPECEMGQDPSPSVIIVGAGAGGCATAARLSKCGWHVTVIEKNDFTGGRCSLIYKDGYRFDQGPSLLLLPQIFHETFRDLGTTMEDEGIQLIKCDSNYKVHFHDNASFTLSTDLARMKVEVERYEGKGGFDRYLSFLKESHQHYEQSVIHVLHKNFFNFWSMFRHRFLPHLLALHVFESVYGRASKYFWTERLRRVFTFASMYMGMSPFDAPGTYSLLQYTELAEGIWYPKGGFHQVVEALVKIGKREGVDFRLNTAVSKMLLLDGQSRVDGVLLDNCEELRADVVICNADLIYAYNNLLPSTSYALSLAKRETSCSSISFYWGLDTQFHELSAHNIFLAEYYKESFDSIFKAKLIPDEPSFYVNVPSRLDPNAAPTGADAVTVLVPVGHMLDASNTHRGMSGGKGGSQSSQDWGRMVSAARDTVLKTLEARLGISLGPHIVSETINTPPSWRERFNLDRGAILGLSHSFFNVLSFRPKTQHPKIKNMYFVGASTHPGTGVPIVLAGAKLVSEQVLRHWNKNVPWEASEDVPDNVSQLDKTQWIPWLEWWNWLTALFLIVLAWTLSVAFAEWAPSVVEWAGDW